MNSLVRRVLSLLLCFCMVLSVVPAVALADETSSDDQQDAVITVAEAEEDEKSGESSDEQPGESSDEQPVEGSDEQPGEGSDEEAAPAGPVKYTVKHYLWNWDMNDYVLLETEELTGMPGELTNAQEKTYEGCILEDEIQQVEILEDGSTVVKICYIELLEEDIPFVETDL